MIPNNMPELQAAFDDWMTQDSDEPPTNGDIVRHDNIDVELLHHLATFIWLRAGGHISSEACQDMFREAGVHEGQTPSEALRRLANTGLITAVNK